MKNIKSLLGILLIALLFSMKVSAYTITLEKDNWQLVSFPKLPQDRSIVGLFGESANNGSLVAIWGFDNANKTWHSWPQQSFDNRSDLVQLETSKGYWIKVTQNIDLNIEGNASNISEQILYPGWNLLGISSETEMSHEQAFAGVPFLELWSYDRAKNSFLSVKKSGGSQIVLQEEFTQVTPHQGYWMYVTEQTSLIPNMGTLLPPDIDLEPLLNLTEYGKETLWDQLTPGDVDWDGDGFFDFPNTQTTVAFGDFLNRQRLSITNEGNGVLSWQARLEPPVKWLLFEAFDENEQPVLTNNVVGNVSDTNGELVMVVNRVGLAPSDNYTTELVLTANGSNAEKRIAVKMAVADVVGDYEITVRLDEIDGKKADLHNPKYFLSFARDGDGVKAFLDEERSLLIPETTYLSGSYINDPESHFQVLGQLYLPKEHEHNPYQADIRREFTIIGQRSDGRDGLSPLDLKGTYAENIYGIFEQPIQLTGEFVATRLSPIPKKKDLTITTPIMGEIVSSAVDGGESIFEFNVTDRYSITDVKTNLRIQHSLPEELDVYLISPENTEIKLHEKQLRSLADVRFDDHDDSVESLDLLNGQLSLGLWKLKIKNYSTTVGQLESWTIDISGAKVYKISGETLPGIRMQLSGCGIVRTVISDEVTGQFEFDGLIPCDYDISVAQLGYEVSTTTVRIEGCFKTISNKCDLESDYNQVLSSDQLAALAPQLVATSGTMKVIVSPTTAMLPRKQDETISLQAVDVTNYSALSKTLNNRRWELFKRVNSWSSISPQGYLVDVEGYGEPIPAGTNYIAYSEDYEQWVTSASIALTETNIIDPRGGVNAINISHNGNGSNGQVFSSETMGQGTFSVLKDEFITFSVFVKKGSSEEIRFRFANGGTFLKAEIMNFTTGAFTGGQDLPSASISLANGWYRASVTYKATEDFSNFKCDIWYGKDGSYNVSTPEHFYAFGPQCEKHSTAAPLIPIMVGDITIMIPQQSTTGYIATEFNHGTRSANAQSDVLIADGQTSSALGSWSHNFDYKPSNAGIYYLKLSSEVQANGVTETISYTSEAINISYQNLTDYHFGIRSVYAAAGTSGMKAMDMATFDIDRPPYLIDGNPQGSEDSDSFKSLADEGTETNQSNDLFQNPEDPSQFSFVPTGMDEQSGNLNKHYRMHISTGQLIHSPPVYGGSFRLDIGIQSSEGAE
jgi:subtilisin-like proprotein convertase family protein